MNRFLKSQDYKTMKLKYEKNYFKLGGAYAYFDGDKITNKTQGSISEQFKNKKITVTDTEGETSKTKNFYQIWSEDPDMREYVEVVFDCGKVKPHQYNLFDGIGSHLKDVKLKKDLALEPILEHFRSMTGYNDEHYEYLLNYCAHLVQKPSQLPSTCLVIISPEGTGKDLFADFIGNVINPKYYVNTDKINSIAGGFNSLLAGKLFTVINETNPV